MTTLLIAEHDNKALKDATHKALTAANALGADVHVLVAGHSCRPVAEAAANLEGVKKVEPDPSPLSCDACAGPTRRSSRLRQRPARISCRELPLCST